MKIVFTALALMVVLIALFMLFLQSAAKCYTYRAESIEYYLNIILTIWQVLQNNDSIDSFRKGNLND